MELNIISPYMHPYTGYERYYVPPPKKKRLGQEHKYPRQIPRDGLFKGMGATTLPVSSLILRQE